MEHLSVVEGTLLMLGLLTTPPQPAHLQGSQSSLGLDWTPMVTALQWTPVS